MRVKSNHRVGFELIDYPQYFNMQIQKEKIIDVSPLFQKCGIDLPTTTIVETEGMYPYKSNIEENWAYFTTVGFQALAEILMKEEKQMENIGIVGIGSGVEGIAALLIFRDHIRRLVISDVDEGILQGATKNLGTISESSHVQLTAVIGSFCESIRTNKIELDLVHANIPNLPANELEDLSKGAEKGTFLPSALYEEYAPPKKFVSWALGAQFAYLSSAKEVVREGGTIITELGGRVPFQLVRELFEEVGLDFQEIVTGFKEQTEALIDFVGYHQLETQFGVEFDFYLYKESIALLEQREIKNPTSEVSADEIKSLLEPYRVSAGKALELYQGGIAVGHTVHLLRGIKRKF